MADGWRYVLASSKDMSELVTFKECKNKTLTLDLNKSGQAGGMVHMREQGSELIFPWSTCIIAKYDDQILWSGPINDPNIDFQAGTVSFTAVGWFERLMSLQIQDLTLSYTNTDAGEIVRQLLLKALAQDANLPVRIGTVQLTQVRTVSYTRGQSIGQAIQDLVALEAGFDWEIDPSTRLLNVYARAGQVRKDCKWIFKMNDGERNPSPDSNLSGCTVNIDGSIVNDIRPIGANTQVTGIVDFVSQSEYGVFQESPSLPEVVDTNILVAFGQAELAYRSEPQYTYTMTPNTSANVNVPLFMRDFELGDTTFLTVKRYWFDVADAPQRIFGVSLSISDVGDVETLSNLQTRAA